LVFVPFKYLFRLIFIPLTPSDIYVKMYKEVVWKEGNMDILGRWCYIGLEDSDAPLDPMSFDRVLELGAGGKGYADFNIFPSTRGYFTWTIGGLGDTLCMSTDLGYDLCYKFYEEDGTLALAAATEFTVSEIVQWFKRLG
jgi:hypothetical protein